MKKGKKWKKIEAFCILLIVTLLLIFVKILYQPGTESERGELYTFSNGWYQLEVCIGDRLLYQYKECQTICVCPDDRRVLFYF